MKIRILMTAIIVGVLLTACSPSPSANGEPTSEATLLAESTQASTVESLETSVGGAMSTTEGSATLETESASTSQPGVSGSTFDVEISGFEFEDSPLTIRVGDTVTWENHDDVIHNVIADDGSFRSANLPNDGRFSFTFTQAGTFTYHCGPHPYMTGTIIVLP